MVPAAASSGPTRLTGLVLAAGEGRRMGGPKALLRLTPHGPTLLERAVSVVRQGGCPDVTVVVGAAADRVAALGERLGARVVEEPGWPEGMGASLRTGLAATTALEADAVLVTLVDLADVTAEVVARVIAAADVADLPSALARAAYEGVAGHPVLLGRRHWPGVAELARGDHGARGYLTAHPARLVECGDLASGRDLDRPADIR